MRIRHFLLFLSCLAALAIGDRIDKRAIKSNPKVSKKSEIIEGSGLPPKVGPGAPSDLEIHGSGAPGYSSDDEDGDEVQGSGVPPPDRVEGSGRPPPPPAVIARPQQTTSTTTTTHAPPLVTGTRSTTTTHAVFNPLERLPDPVVHVEEKDRDTVITEIREPPPRPETTQAVAPPTTTTTKRTPAASPADDDAHTPFSPIPRPGIIAAIIGGAVIGVITAVMLVMFIIHRMRKKDEGSYALDEPKPRPYSSYQYTKASTKEFYA